MFNLYFFRVSGYCSFLVVICPILERQLQMFWNLRFFSIFCCSHVPCLFVLLVIGNLAPVFFVPNLICMCFSFASLKR